MVGDVKEKIMGLFKTKTTKCYYKATHVNVYKSGKKRKKIKEIEDNIIKDITYHFESEKEEEENYYQPVKNGNFYGNNYIKYESNDDRSKTLSIKEYLEKIKPYLKDILNNLNKLINGKFN